MINSTHNNYSHFLNKLKLQSLLIVFSSLLFVPAVRGQALNADRVELSYNQCTGSLIVEFWAEDGTDADCYGTDQLATFSVTFTESGDEKPLFHMVTNNSWFPSFPGLLNTYELLWDLNFWPGNVYPSTQHNISSTISCNKHSYYRYLAPTGTTVTHRGAGNVTANKGFIVEIPLPPISTPNISINIVGTRQNYTDIGNPIGSYYDYHTGSESVMAPAPSLATVQGFNATNDVCDKINLTWTQFPALIGASELCTEPARSIVILHRVEGAAGSLGQYRNINERDNSIPASFAYRYNTENNPIVFTPTVSLPNLPVGQTNQFQIKHVFNQNAYRTVETPILSRSGNALIPPVIPTLTTVTNMGCVGDDMTISWSYGSDPTNFTLQRATDMAFTQNVKDDFPVIPGDMRSTTDASAEVSTSYYYRLRASNICPIHSDYSTPKEGFIEGPPLEPTNVQADPRTNHIRVTWDNPSDFITGLVLERTFTGGGSSLIIPVHEDSLGYSDFDVSQCVTYTYKVKAKSRCFPTGVGTKTASALLGPDLSQTFPAGGFNASKGYFANKIELTWTNNMAGQTNAIKIYRRILDSGDSLSLLTTLNSGSGIYNDLFADAGELYQYQIIAEGLCENTTIYSDSLRTIGYRRKTGIVTGRVEYEDGTNVADVKITANDPGITVLPSLYFNGSGTATVPAKNSLNMGQELIIESWMKPVTGTYANNFTVLEKAGAYSLKYNATSANYIFEINTNNGTFSASVTKDSLPEGDWNSLSAMYFQDTMKLFVSGILLTTQPIGVTGSDITDNTQPVLIGKDYTGYLKDVKLWNQGKTEKKIQQDHARFLAGNELGLVMYLYAGEGKGDHAYDLSRLNNTYYKNHAQLSSGITWDLTENRSTDNIPLAQMIKVASYTTQEGNYTMVVPYGGSGQNFIITPVLNIHQFTPGTRGVYLGDGSSVQNGVNFVDDSSFGMEGIVYYKDMNCTVDEVMILIDGIPARNQDGIITTGPDGIFNINVPIGPHVIKMQKTNHGFSVGRFPESGSYNFQGPVGREEFIDSTFRKVIGRVVGGDREKAKPHGLGRSNNNIGMATLVFNPSGTCGWKASSTETFPLRDTALVRTIDSSGEFAIYLPPLSFNVDEVSTNELDLTGNISGPLNLTNKPFEKTIIDTVFIEGTTFIESIDSVSYHEILEVVYHSPTAIDVTNPEGSGPLESDEEYIFFHEAFEPDTISLTPVNPFPFPVFTQNKTYQALISTFQEYVNSDGPEPVYDRVPVLEGVMTITNELAAVNSIDINLNGANGYDGDTLYTFSGGSPNLASDGSLNMSHTKEFRIDLDVPGPGDTSWEPLYRGYLVGTENVAQSDFGVNGPSLVSYVLHDPPGSQSFAERSLETSSTTENTFEWNVGGGGSADIFISAGVKFETGIGYVTPFKVESETNIGISTETAGGQGGSIIETLVNTETWTTSAEPLLAGPQSDLFIGTSDVYLFGVSTTLTFTPESTCTNATITCTEGLAPFDVGGVNYRLATVKRLALAKSGIATDFVLPRWKIETDEIPDLIEQRNQLLAKGFPYQEVLGTEHPCYGYNNDDPRLGTPACPNTFPGTGDPEVTTLTDRSGPSYIFLDTDPARIDSVRIWNQGIRLWEEALGTDERHKYEALQSGEPTIGNKVFAGASGSFTRSISNGISVVNQQQFEFLFEETLSHKIGAEIAGIGGSDEFGISLTQQRSSVDIQTADTTHTVSFTLSDDSEWDDFTVDVYEGGATYGPIFDVLAGRTSCPHEDKDISKYFQPGEILSHGTIQLEQPEILISPRVLYNVPQDESGVFQMTLKNNNQVGEAWEYSTQIINTTNPNSLAVNVGSSDDLSLNWVIPPIGQPGALFTRDFFVDIGTAYDNEDIMVVIHSTCQYQQGLSIEPDIVDTAYFSIHFIPGCTELSMPLPGDQWVVNSSNNNQVELKVEDYDINYLNLDLIKLWYKASSSPTWLPLETYYKDSIILETMPDAEIIPRSTAYTEYNMDLLTLQLPDGAYDFRATSDCQVATEESPVYSGYIDRINPHAFGSPSPADGILDPNDDIRIQFNEIIDIGSVGPANFTVLGVTNGTSLSENASIAFDGNSHFASIPEYQLQKRDFTAEFWIKRDRDNIEEVILSQGTNLSNQLLISFNADNTLHFQLGNKFRNGDKPITNDQIWHHVAISYDRELSRVLISVDNADPEVFYTSFTTDYTGSGLIHVGHHIAGGLPNFQGKIREMRLWGIPRVVSEIGPKSGVILSGREAGLIGNWPMNEAFGTTAFDKVRSRHMTMNGATWAIDPASHSYMFDGGSDSLRVVDAGQLSILEESDMTIEAWIKTPGNGQRMSVISNGISAPDSSLWNIYINTTGNLVIANNGNELTVPLVLTDDKWHHMAIVVERNQSVSVYHNGNLTTTGNASLFNSFGGPSLYLGVLGDQDNNNVLYSDFFTGHLDEVRIWSLARRPEQIKRDFVNQLSGEELGLQAYYPFDEYHEGNNVYVSSLMDASSNSFDLSPLGISNTFPTVTPTIKLPRRVEEMTVFYSINQDEMIIEPQKFPYEIENTTLDITVEGVKDLAGNTMLKGETWIAYVNKNQVFWESEYYNITKDIEGSVSFTARIKNTGGRQEVFTLSNIPTWMSASTTGGLIEPNSNLDVTFTILPGIDIGEYEQDIFVSTASFGFNERLLLDLKVMVDPPVWIVDEGDFSFSMNIIGEFKVNDYISTDLEDMVSVWVNDELRGVTHVEFDETSSKYLVFLTIWSNSNLTGSDSLEFRAWDASRGNTLVQLEPTDMLFANNDIVGTRGNPVPILATALAERTYVLETGWNWISFPLASTILDNVNTTFTDLSPAIGDQVKSQDKFHTYDGTSWQGNIPGFNTNEGYKLRSTSVDTFKYTGTFINPTEEPIDINPGWNWISVKSESNVDVPTALNNLHNLQDGDLIKSQSGFAIYETGFGWGGNLNFVSPKKGYMLFYNTNGQVIFPNNNTAFINQPEERRSLAKAGKKTVRRKSLQYTPGNYSSNMSLTADIEECLAIAPNGDTLDLSNWLLVGYAETEVRGISEASWISSLNQYIYYLTIEGDETTDISFRLIHASSGEMIQLNQGLTYEVNQITGTTRNPFRFTCGAMVACEDNVFLRTADIDATQTNISKGAQFNFKTDAVLPTGISFRFSGGNELEFIGGFESALGAAIEAYIESCND